MSEKVSDQEKSKSNRGGGASLKILSSLPNLVVANVRKLSKSNNEQSSSSSKKRNSIATSSSTDQFPLYPFQWHAFNNQSNHSYSTNDISQLLSANQNHSSSLANYSSAYINNNYEMNDSVNYRPNNSKQMEELKNKDKRYSWAVGDRQSDYLRYESDKFRNFAGGKYGGLLSHSPIREVDYESEEVFDKQERVPLTSRNNDSRRSNNNGNTENWLLHHERNSSGSGGHTCFNNSENRRSSAMIAGSRKVQYSSEAPISYRRDRDAKSGQNNNSSNSYTNNYINQPNNSNNYNNYRHQEYQENLPLNANNRRMGRPHSVYVMQTDALENYQYQIDTTESFNPGKFQLENTHWNECNATSYTASQTLEIPNNYAAVSSVGTESLNVTSIFGEGVDTVTSSAYSSFADRGESSVTAVDDMHSSALNYRMGEPKHSGSMRENQPRDQIASAWNKEKATIIKLLVVLSYKL